MRPVLIGVLIVLAVVLGGLAVFVVDRSRQSVSAQENAPPAAPYAGKSYDSPKYGEITFRPDGLYLSSDQKPGTAHWYRVDDVHALVWTEGGWGTLFVFDNHSASAYSIGHVDDKAAWVAPELAAK